MKSTKIRRINRKKTDMGISVTAILNYLGEASFENLTHHVRNRSNQSMEYICSAVQRTLQYGVRNGFILKRKEKYCLSGRNYVTDSPEPTPFNRQLFDQCEGVHSACLGNEANNTCSAMDLLTLDHCKRKTNNNERYCTVHNHLNHLFGYRMLFTKNIKEVAWSGITSEFKISIERISQKSLDKYLEFLEKYYEYIFNYSNTTPATRGLIKRVLNRTTWADTVCIGMNVETGEQCNASADAGMSCWHHRYILFIMKCFSHCNIGDQEKERIYFDGFNYKEQLFQSLQTSKWSGELKEGVQLVPDCIRRYLAFIVRLECVMIAPSVRTENSRAVLSI